mgnify:CR=1 FL=1
MIREIDWEWIRNEVAMIGCVIGMAACVCGLAIIGYLAISNG